MRMVGLNGDIDGSLLARGQIDERDRPAVRGRKGETRKGHGGILRRGMPQQVEEDGGPQELGQERWRKAGRDVVLRERAVSIELGEDPGKLVTDWRSGDLHWRCADNRRSCHTRSRW